MEREKFQLEVIEPIEEEELVEDDYELRAETERMLDYAISHGLCNAEDAADWMIGFDACEKIEYKENLVMILAEKCLPSGEELDDKYDEHINSPYLSPARKRVVAEEWKQASVRDREGIVKAVKKEIEEKKRRYAMFNRLLLKIQVESLRKQLEQKFADADLAEAKRLIDELSKRTDKRDRAEAVTPDVKAALDKIRQLIGGNNFRAARELLDSVGVVLNFSGEYRELVREIDQGEIELARASLAAA
jgi:hypothetical protein